jgi:ATP-dependent 26S proteasome regulatory subunit
MHDVSVARVIAKMGADSRDMPSGDELEQIQGLIHQLRTDPNAVVAEVLRTGRRAAKAEQQCAQAADAATNLEQMLEELLTGNCLLCHLEGIRRTDDGVTAVCRSGGQIKEFPLHPEMDAALLEELAPWEFVRINEQVVVGTWQDDPALFTAAHGDVVTFNAYCDQDTGLVQVVHDGHTQTVVRLAKHLRDKRLDVTSKLVLLRDDPRWAIATVPTQQTESKFEVPIETIDTRLEDLAGIEPIARQLIEDVVMHVVNPLIRKQFGLKQMNGFLLMSRRPGMGKTAFMRAFAYWLHELGQKMGFEVVLYVVPPNAWKSMWHGEDARIVREELWGAIRARQALPRTNPLLQFVVLDEVDSIGRRADASVAITSSAQSDALEAMLAEMDGMVKRHVVEDPPVYVLFGGTTNLPERVDEALKRPGRLGDLVLEMPTIDFDGAENILVVHSGGPQLPWYLDDEIRSQVDEDEIRSQLVRPALAGIFPAVALHYTTDTQRRIEVTAGEILAGVHYEQAMNLAKKRAAGRSMRDFGVAAVAFDDLATSLAEVAHSAAQQMEADPNMLVRQLSVKHTVAHVEAVPEEQLAEHRYFGLSPL